MSGVGSATDFWDEGDKAWRRCSSARPAWSRLAASVDCAVESAVEVELEAAVEVDSLV